MALAPCSRSRIEALLGSGGTGEVYRAHDTRLIRTVALKVLRSEKLGDSGRGLLEKTQSASALNHPDIVTVAQRRS